MGINNLRWFDYDGRTNNNNNNNSNNVFLCLSLFTGSRQREGHRTTSRRVGWSAREKQEHFNWGILNWSLLIFTSVVLVLLFSFILSLIFISFSFLFSLFLLVLPRYLTLPSPLPRNNLDNICANFGIYGTSCPFVTTPYEKSNIVFGGKMFSSNIVENRTKNRQLRIDHVKILQYLNNLAILHCMCKFLHGSLFLCRLPLVIQT